MDQSTEITETILPTIQTMGFEIVRIAFNAQPRLTLQVMVEPINGGVVCINDCAKISRVVSAILDVTDLIDDTYYLEISSPGIDRPLVRLADYQHYVGHLAKIETRHRIDGQRRFRGTLLGLDGENVRISIENSEVDLPFDDITAAKLILTEELIAGFTK